MEFMTVAAFTSFLNSSIDFTEKGKKKLTKKNNNKKPNIELGK